MDDKLVQKFQERFKWFPKKDPLYHADLNFPMSIDCGNGWFDLIWKLCEDIDIIVKCEGWENFSVDQIKEKFAGLRFYVNGANREVFDLIHKAEDKSYEICEVCGKKGSMYLGFGWYRTLCAKCAKKDSTRHWVKVKRKNICED
jgi:hypothetical protein